MASSDNLMFLGIAGLVVYTLSKVGSIASGAKDAVDEYREDKAVDSSEQMGGQNTETIPYGSVDVERVEQSELDPSTTNLRVVNDDDSLTTYKIDPKDYNFFEEKMIKGGFYDIEDGIISFDEKSYFKSLIGFGDTPSPATPPTSIEDQEGFLYFDDKTGAPVFRAITKKMRIEQGLDMSNVSTTNSDEQRALRALESERLSVNIQTDSLGQGMSSAYPTHDNPDPSPFISKTAEAQFEGKFI